MVLAFRRKVDRAESSPADAAGRDPLEAPAVPAAAPASVDPARFAEGDLLGGRYELGRLLGEGGKATVRAARDQLLGRDVAIKMFRARASSKDELRLQEAEAQVIASFNHYALTTLFDAGIEAASSADPQIYLVMEHVVGSDLKTRLKQGPLEVAEACWLGFDLIEALGYVHHAGFLHRDIKPANVLLSDLRSAKPIVGKLADFGITSLIGEPDLSEFTAGTAAYLSPEQVEGLDPVPASDTYALGLVLLEAITGKVEYPGGVEASAFARLDRDPRIPAELPKRVADVLRGMTALDPADRISLPAAALELQQHLVDDLIRRREVDAGLLHDEEAARLAALRRFDILDTAPDETFDAITRVASTVLDTPIALVTLIDMDRVWFKSHLGWDEQQVDRDIAFCTTTNPGIAGPWTVPDALLDDRTRGNPLVTDGPQVRSYAGAPMITRDGHNLGSLCVFDREPRDFTPKQLEALQDLSGLVMHEMEMRAATRRALFERG